MNSYYTTRPLKSKTTAILLSIFFGPLGLLYASVSAGLKMILCIPILFFILMGFSALTGIPVLAGFTAIAFLFFLFFYWPICIIWASITVDKYNRKIQEEDYLSQQHTTGSQQEFVSISTEVPNNYDLIEKKELLQIELANLKSRHEKKEITEVEYVIKKEKLEKQIEILNHNLSFSTNTTSAQDRYNNENSKKKDYSYLLILLLVALIALSLIGYQKGWFFDMHGKDKTLIKEQIEKTYFGIANGAYTSSTIQGIGADGMPFYNINFENVTLMGLTPLANIFGFKIQIEPKNIDVYNFIDDNTAQVKYDLLVLTGNETDSAKIDMVVKKIGGYWKLDGEKFLGEHKSSTATANKKNESSSLAGDDKYLSQDFVNNPKNTAWKIKAYREDANNPETQFQDSELDRYIIFNKKIIYTIINGRIDIVWHVTKQYYDDEYLVIKTKEGFTLTQFEHITITDPKKYSIEYDGYNVPIKDIPIDKFYIR